MFQSKLNNFYKSDFVRKNTSYEDLIYKTVGGEEGLVCISVPNTSILVYTSKEGCFQHKSNFLVIIVSNKLLSLEVNIRLRVYVVSEMDKHASLLWRGMNYSCKEFYIGKSDQLLNRI